MQLVPAVRRRRLDRVIIAIGVLLGLLVGGLLALAQGFDIRQVVIAVCLSFLIIDAGVGAVRQSDRRADAAVRRIWALHVRAALLLRREHLLFPENAVHGRLPPAPTPWTLSTAGIAAVCAEWLRYFGDATAESTDSVIASDRFTVVLDIGPHALPMEEIVRLDALAQAGEKPLLVLALAGFETGVSRPASDRGIILLQPELAAGELRAWGPLAHAFTRARTFHVSASPMQAALAEGRSE